MLIGLTGKAGSGKDTVGNLLVSRHGFERIAYADVIKRVAEDLNPLLFHDGGFIDYLSETLSYYKNNWDEAKQRPAVRKYLQELGSVIRGIDPEFWVRAADVPPMNTPGNYVVTDVRTEDELADVIDKGGTVVRVSRPGSFVNDHITETVLDGYTLPTIENHDSLNDLALAVSNLVDQITRGERP